MSRKHKKLLEKALKYRLAGKKEKAIKIYNDIISGDNSEYRDEARRELEIVTGNSNRIENLQDTPQRENECEALPFIVSEVGKTRYMIEHQLLKDHFYQTPDRLAAILSQEDGAFDLYNISFEKMNMENPYKKNEFSTEVYKDSECTLVMMEPPKPEYTPLCYRIYCVYSHDLSEKAYYTIERGRTGGFLCMWAGDTHAQFHHIENPEWKENVAFMKALEAKIILDKFKGRQ